MIPVAILAGGKGTRLGSIATDIPKPMVPVLGKPLLEWQFDLAHFHKAPSVTVFAGHKAEICCAWQASHTQLADHSFGQHTDDVHLFDDYLVLRGRGG